jgi:hypothetical protein
MCDSSPRRLTRERLPLRKGNKSMTELLKESEVSMARTQRCENCTLMKCSCLQTNLSHLSFCLTLPSLKCWFKITWNSQGFPQVGHSGNLPMFISNSYQSLWQPVCLWVIHNLWTGTSTREKSRCLRPGLISAGTIPCGSGPAPSIRRLASREPLTLPFFNHGAFHWHYLFWHHGLENSQSNENNGEILYMISYAFNSTGNFSRLHSKADFLR